MQSLEEMRKELDVIDDQITTLYERRMKVCEGVAEYKIKNGRKVFDKTRENEKLAAVAEKVSTDFNKKGIRELFEQLMSMSRKLQYQRLSEEGVLGRLPFIGLDQLDLDGARVVFQGVEGANNQAAMLKYFGKNVKNFHVSSFRDAMEAIEEGSAAVILSFLQQQRERDRSLTARCRLFLLRTAKSRFLLQLMS